MRLVGSFEYYNENINSLSSETNIINLLLTMPIKPYLLSQYALLMIFSVMYPRFIHITLAIPQRIAAFLLAQIHGDSPLDSWEFQYGKKFHSQFACLRTFTFLKGNYAHTSLVKL